MCFKASSLAPVIDVEITKTNTSFLAFEVLDTNLHSVSVCYSWNM